MLELPQGANTDAQTPNGTTPNQEHEFFFFTKIGNLTQFSKIPNFEKP